MNFTEKSIKSNQGDAIAYQISEVTKAAIVKVRDTDKLGNEIVIQNGKKTGCKMYFTTINAGSSRYDSEFIEKMTTQQNKRKGESVEPYWLEQQSPEEEKCAIGVKIPVQIIKLTNKFGKEVKTFIGATEKLDDSLIAGLFYYDAKDFVPEPKRAEDKEVAE